MYSIELLLQKYAFFISICYYEMRTKETNLGSKVNPSKLIK